MHNGSQTFDVVISCQFRTRIRLNIFDCIPLEHPRNTSKTIYVYVMLLKHNFIVIPYHNLPRSGRINSK